MDALVKQTRDYIQTHSLVKRGGQLLAAVSGGRDSCVMLHILLALRDELGFSLSVAHFDHQLRPESRAEQDFVWQLAQGYGLPFYAGSADVRAVGGNVEDAARRARYAFLRKTAGQAGAQVIATAHHAQDQAETMLMHLMRGCGLEGLAAIAPKEWDIVRPLLTALPEQIEAYRAAHSLAFCQDESNFDPSYLRNHLRMDVLPLLLDINPRLLACLSATADICREDDSLLTAWAAVSFGELWQEETQALDESFFKLPPALQRRLIRLAFSRMAGQKQELSYAHAQAVLALKEEQSASMPGGWLFYRRGSLFIGKQQPSLPEYNQVIAVVADGKWHTLADWGWAYMAELTDTKAPLPSLAFRTRRAGDSLPSTGKQGRRKVKDIFIDAKIPPYRRAAWPLLVEGEQILWLPGLSGPPELFVNGALAIRVKRVLE